MTAAARQTIHVAPYFPPHVGGMERVAQTIAEGMAADGPVEVLTSSVAASRPVGTERRGALTVRRLWTWDVAHVPLMPTLLPHLLRARGRLFHVHIAQAFVPEMVWLAARIRGLPYVAHFHLDVQPSGPLGPLFLAYKRLVLGSVLRGAARVIVLTETQADFVQRRYRVAREAVAVVPNGVSPGFAELGARSAAAAGPLKLLFVGRLAPQKNLPLLLRAVALTAEPVALSIVGDGEDRAALEGLARELDLEVSFHGALHGAALLEQYARADAFVITSEREGMPLVVLEAMAAGLPIVGTHAPGTTETVADSGLLTEPEPDALARAIDTLARDPAVRADLARRSRARGREHAWPSVIDRLRTVYAAVEG